MSHFGAGVEYGLHCLLHLAATAGNGEATARDLAEFQGISPSYVAKLFTTLERAGLVSSAEGARGGFRLARPAHEITVDQVVSAIEGPKPLFKCREIRRDCILYKGTPPAWSTEGVCAIHGLMVQAEGAMREVLRATSLADLARGVEVKCPAEFSALASGWFEERRARRARPRHVRKPKGQSRNSDEQNQ